ncbi:MAG: hypothetical protein IPF99_21580 [Deltaproteobacteria bacterium]|nr:hypothetical protein [Deltaproteobacteria bacterium]
MARYGFHALLASLHVEDTPIWVNSPFGPAISLRAAYNQADFTQSSLPRMSGLGPKWSFTFRQFITEEVVSDGAQPQFYKLHVGAGGVLDYRFSGSATASQAELTDRSVLTRVVPGGTTLPTTFRRALSDGSIEEYDRVVSTMPGRTFALTRVVDPHGNAITLYYDDYLRLTFVTDARGEGLSFYYDPSALADSAAFYQIVRVETTPTSPTQVADFGYTSGRLTSIRDMAGMVSSFLYRSEARGLDHPAPPENVASPPDPDPDFLYRMTTPYGDTNFSTGWVPDGGSNPYSYNRR